MKIAIVTGSFGLVGSTVVDELCNHFDSVIGIDNDMRARFFGKQASVRENGKRLISRHKNYSHKSRDIRDGSIEYLFEYWGNQIELIVHTAAQPSHDWAATDPIEDFTINANGTLQLLELTMRYCPQAVFIFTSTNKVYGDNPNLLPFVEGATRYDVEPGHRYGQGIDESMSIDHCKHSLFGVSKTAADLMVQEYGKYFGLRTGIFRCGCISGAVHAGSQQHGFLSYLMKCAYKQEPYTIIGYKGKQVRDNIDARDLAQMFMHFYRSPKVAAVYNAGGGMESNCSVLEAVIMAEEITGNKMHITHDHKPRSGDHQWYISDTRKFMSDYPEWQLRYKVRDILNDIYSYLAGK